ncbi:MAG: hypothetical protein ACAI38_19110 [Myxococcota bacterium]|nr:hypothetical protein [Myxococcota bacterium]
MADKTFYRYIDANGDAHFVDAANEIPREYKGALEKLTIKDNTGTAKAIGVAEDIAGNAVDHMHWPSFAWGLGLAAAVFLVMRIVAIGKMAFIGLAALLAAGGVGAGFLTKNIKSHLPSSVTNIIPSGADLKQVPTPAEAKRILDSLPKAGVDRDKTLEALFQGEKK